MKHRPSRLRPKPFEILSAAQRDYLTYVRTSQRFQNPEIRDWVLERVQSGTLLWKPPFIQLSHPFAPGEPLADLVAEGLLHQRTLAIFRHDPDDPSSRQEVLYDRDESPLAVADFTYRRGRVVVFVDGSPHYQGYVQAADERKRKRLKALGYRVVVVRAENPEAGLSTLAARMGG